MPFQVGGVAVHDDGQHTGSAKRDTANGVAGLLAGGHIIGLGNALVMPRDGADQLKIHERTSGEDAIVITRMAATDYDMAVNESGVNQQVQTASMKDVASGIAGLDAAAKVPDANLESPVGTHAADTSTHGSAYIGGMASGSYTGNGTQNRAIAHGLGVIPKFVLIFGTGTANFGMMMGAPSVWRGVHNTNDSTGTVTAWTATNFYVGIDAAGDLGNTNLISFYWMALG